MEEKLITRIAQAVVAVVILTGIVFVACGVDLLSAQGLGKISAFFSVITLFCWFYFKYGWKWPLIKWIAYKENLNGTWLGTYKSVNALDQKTYEGEIALVIRQTFLTTSIISFTSKYSAFSYGASVLHKAEHDYYKLVYLYSQDKTNPTQEKARKGTSELDLIIGETEKKLSGTFWTNHNSHGGIEVTFIHNKHFNSFKDIINEKKEP
jgi:hypothetical protein